mmetsp:Transcript_16477/g.25844  ORF Transcript_16477/g.25844 Transcript_16477/m.25844 type:complete len:91 (-) Transcript_16477:1682-1954(-)
MPLPPMFLLRSNNSAPPLFFFEVKTDKDIGIIQNDAAIVATAALEQFVKDFATKSLALATRKGRNTIKYDDVAEVRASDRSLSFLDMLLP